MPRPYPAEFRARAIAIARAGKPQKQTAEDLGIHPVTLSKWIKQDDIDRGERPGIPTSESAELLATRRRIRELETVTRPGVSGGSRSWEDLSYGTCQQVSR